MSLCCILYTAHLSLLLSTDVHVCINTFWRASLTCQVLTRSAAVQQLFKIGCYHLACFGRLVISRLFSFRKKQRMSPWGRSVSFSFQECFDASCDRQALRGLAWVWHARGWDLRRVARKSMICVSMRWNECEGRCSVDWRRWDCRRAKIRQDEHVPQTWALLEWSWDGNQWMHVSSWMNRVW